jgi:hypothetical protein
LAAFSQEISSDKLPKPGRQAFLKQFPTAKVMKYELDKTDYKIGFQDQGKEGIVRYIAAGKLLETKREITSAGLPKEVSPAVAKNFREYTIISPVRREVFNKRICFEMDLKKDDAGYSFRFSDKGEILLKEAKKVEDRVTTQKG